MDVVADIWFEVRSNDIQCTMLSNPFLDMGQYGTPVNHSPVGRRQALDRTVNYSYRHDGGFTLMELAVVVFILGALVAIAITSFVLANSTSARVACHSNMRILEASADSFRLDHDNADPASITDLRPYVANFDSVITCPKDPEVALEFSVTSGTVTVECPIHPR